MLTESQGCDVLAEVFAARGYHVLRNVDFRARSVAFNADGWDPGARVGFEYLTTEAGDHEELGADALSELRAMMERGEAYFFLVDETDVADADELRTAAGLFLDEVARRRLGRRL